MCGGSVEKKELRMSASFQDFGRRLVVRQRTAEKRPYEERRRMVYSDVREL